MITLLNKDRARDVKQLKRELVREQYLRKKKRFQLMKTEDQDKKKVDETIAETSQMLTEQIDLDDQQQGSEQELVSCMLNSKREITQ